MNAEIFKYVKYVLRRIWLVILAAMLVGGAGYAFFVSRAPDFASETKIFIGNALDLPRADIQQVDIGLRLAATYAELAKSYEVREQTIEELDLDLSPEALLREMSTDVIIDTTILVIEVTTEDREQSALIANTLARNFIAWLPSSLSEVEARQLELLQPQINEINEDINENNAQQLQILEQIDEASAEEDEGAVTELTEQYNRLIDQNNELVSNLSTLQSTLAGLAQRVNRLTIIEEARPSVGSPGLNPLIIGFVGAVIGSGMAVGGLLLFLEFVDRNLRTEKEVKSVLEMPVLGEVPWSLRVNFNHSRYLETGELVESIVAEGYRNVQTNLLFPSRSTQGETRVYQIISPRPSEGRSFTTANLGLILAESGFKTLVIDADLREPKLNKFFKLENTVGVSALLNTEPKNPDDARTILEENIQTTRFDKLNVMASGLGGSPRPSQLLVFDGLAVYIDALQEMFDYDIVLIDTPPCLRVADSYNLAGSIAPNVIMVVESGRTNEIDALRAKDQFLFVGASLSGVILNKV